MSEQNLLQVAIIGLGGVGERIFNACLEHPLIEIAIICDLAEERVMRLAEHHNLAWCTDYREILTNPTIDLVYVGVPPKYHHKITLDALREQKHILCEKPLANSVEQAAEMYELASKSGVIHAMNFPTYYRNSFYELSKRVKDGFLGDLKRIEVKAHFHLWPREWQQNDWIGGREQGGFIREVLPHYIHLIRVLFGPIQNVKSWVQYPEMPALCETGMLATAQLNNGVSILFNGVSQVAAQEEIAFTLYGSAGTLSLRNWNVLKAGASNESLATVQVAENDRTRDMLNQLVRAIRGDRANIIDFEEGYEIQRILESLLAIHSRKNETNSFTAGVAESNERQAK
jgi:predicted dehydrogenase